MLKNQEIRQLIKNSRILQYEIAAQVGVSEYTLCKWFRKPLTDEQQGKILAAIEKIRSGERNEI